MKIKLYKDKSIYSRVENDKEQFKVYLEQKDSKKMVIVHYWMEVVKLAVMV